MLEIIKKYRNSPKRTVITFSLDESISLNRQGDLRKAKHAYVKQKDIENDGASECCTREIKGSELAFDCGCDFVNEGEKRREGAERCSCDGETLYAFKTLDNVCSENSEKECIDVKADEKCDCLSGKTGDNKPEKNKSIYLTYPCCKMELKGGVRSKKTVRILLSDVIAVTMGAFAIKCVISKLNKKK